MPDEAEVDTDLDTTTLATDRECLEIEAKARTRKVFHWPELVRVINRMRAAERRAETAKYEAKRWRDVAEKQASWEMLWSEQADRAEAAEKRAEAAEKRAGSDVKYEAALIRAVAELGYDVAYAKDAEGVVSAVLEARS